MPSENGCLLHLLTQVERKSIISKCLPRLTSFSSALARDRAALSVRCASAKSCYGTLIFFLKTLCRNTWGFLFFSNSWFNPDGFDFNVILRRILTVSVRIPHAGSPKPTIREAAPTISIPALYSVAITLKTKP
jgi:hypothetical protein